MPVETEVNFSLIMNNFLVKKAKKALLQVFYQKFKMPCKDAIIFQMSLTIHRIMLILSGSTLADICFNHGTIIRTGITCKKISCYMCDSVCRWLIVKNAKIFRSYVKHF